MARKSKTINDIETEPKKKLQRSRYGKKLVEVAVESYDDIVIEASEIEPAVSISQKEVENALECQCTIYEVSSLVGVTIEELREWSLKIYRMPIELVKDKYFKRGVAKLRVLIYKNILEGDIDFHKIYGKKILEDIDAQNMQSDETGLVTTYELQLPSNNR